MKERVWILLLNFFYLQCNGTICTIIMVRSLLGNIQLLAWSSSVFFMRTELETAISIIRRSWSRRIQEMAGIMQNWMRYQPINHIFNEYPYVFSWSAFKFKKVINWTEQDWHLLNWQLLYLLQETENSNSLRRTLSWEFPICLVPWRYTLKFQ